MQYISQFSIAGRYATKTSLYGNAVHYSDVIMSAMASHIIGVSVVCSTVCSTTDQRKHRSSVSPVTGGFPLQRASNKENVFIWWRHHAPSLALCWRDSPVYMRWGSWSSLRFNQGLVAWTNDELSSSRPPGTYLWDSKYLAFIARLVSAFGMNPKLGVSSRPHVEIYSVSQTSTLS